MQIVSLTEVRNNLKVVFDSVNIDHEEVIIHRKGRENIVMIYMDEYNFMKETNYLLSSPKNKERLLSILKHSREGKITEKELLES